LRVRTGESTHERLCPAVGAPFWHDTGVADVLDDARTKVVLRRYLQYVLDLLLVLLVALVVFVLCFGIVILAAKTGARGRLLVYVPFVAWIVALFLFTMWTEIWVPHRRGGATPAMRWLGLKIVTVRGTEPALRDYFLRWLLMAVDGMFFGLLGAALIAFTPQHQRLGDIVTRTLVVRAR
jgi:uncharacterized RDD family membrane protein YckC